MDGRTEKSIFYSSKQPFYLGKMLPKPRQSTIDLHLAPGKKKEKLSDLVFCFCFPDLCPLFGVVMMDGGEGEGGAPLWRNSAFSLTLQDVLRHKRGLLPPPVSPPLPPEVFSSLLPIPKSKDGDDEKVVRPSPSFFRLRLDETHHLAHRHSVLVVISFLLSRPDLSVRAD